MRVSDFGSNPCMVRPALRSHSNTGRMVHCHAADSGKSADFLETVKKVGKKIQGSLPIIGLLSRLTAPEGGFGEISYKEFCRATYDQGSADLLTAFGELEKRHGKPADRKYTFMVLWMAKYGAGLVAAKDMLNAAKRLRVTQDLEIEIDRFENARDIAIKKYALIDRPEPQLSDCLDLSIDCVSCLCLGIPEAQPVPPEERQLLVDLMEPLYPAAGTAAIVASMERKSERARA